LATVAEIMRLLGAADDEAPVFIHADEHSMQLVLTRRAGMVVMLASKLMEGVYPNWRTVVPKEREGLAMNREAMGMALARVSGLVAVEGEPVEVRWDSASGMLRLIVSSAESGEAEDLVPAGGPPAGAPSTMKVSGIYVREQLAACAPDEGIRWMQVDDMSPLVLRAQGNEWGAVVMPLRT
jgi:DNA polymerase III sliding clamp (beta) subunit (PCNA family)